MDIDCVLLAGGSSRRMGQPKLLLSLGDRTVFEHALAAHLASSLRRVCAVVPGWLSEFSRMAARLEGDRVAFEFLAGECDMSESLKAGWRRIMEGGGPDGILVSLADKPLVEPEVIDAVINRFADGDCDICVPVYGGSRGHPVVLNAALGGDVMGLEGDRGARDILESGKSRVAEVGVDSDGVLVDMDTRDDLERIRRRLDQFGRG